MLWKGTGPDAWRFLCNFHSLIFFGLLPIHIALVTFAGETNLFTSLAVMMPMIPFFFFLAFHFIKNKVFSPDYCIQDSQKHDAILKHHFSLYVFSYTLWISNLPGLSPYYKKIMYFSALFPCYSHEVQSNVYQVSKSCL